MKSLLFYIVILFFSCHHPSDVACLTGNDSIANQRLEQEQTYDTLPEYNTHLNTIYPEGGMQPWHDGTFLLENYDPCDQYPFLLNYGKDI